jgi:hypothetical protein
VICMGIQRRKIHFSTDAILPLMEDFWAGLLWDYYRELLPKKLICLTTKIADSEWSLIKLEQRE